MPGPVAVVVLVGVVQLEHVHRFPVATDDHVLGGRAEGQRVNLGEIAASAKLVQFGVFLVVHLEHPDDGTWW